jgi:hypothetical protein
MWEARCALKATIFPPIKILILQDLNFVLHANAIHFLFTYYKKY